MNVDYKEIKDYFYKNRYWDNATRKYAEMFEKVSQIIDENDILCFYPKYLFVDEQNLQLYFILKNNKFIKVWINEEKRIVMQFLNMNKIKNVIYECPLGDYGDHRLTYFCFLKKMKRKFTLTVKRIQMSIGNIDLMKQYVVWQNALLLYNIFDNKKIEYNIYIHSRILF